MKKVRLKRTMDVSDYIRQKQAAEEYLFSDEFLDFLRHSDVGTDLEAVKLVEAWEKAYAAALDAVSKDGLMSPDAVIYCLAYGLTHGFISLKIIGEFMDFLQAYEAP